MIVVLVRSRPEVNKLRAADAVVVGDVSLLLLACESIGRREQAEALGYCS